MSVLLLRKTYPDDVKRRWNPSELNTLNAQKDKLEIVTGSYDEVIDNIDLYKLTEFIIDLHNQDWTPKCYWTPIMKDGRFNRADKGEIQWSIYSYLVSNGMMVVEDQYYGDTRYNTKNKYKLKTSFDNSFIADLYNPIIDRLVDNRFFIHVNFDYVIDISYLREIKLNELGI